MYTECQALFIIIFTRAQKVLQCAPMKYLFWFAGITAIIAEVSDTPWPDVLIGSAVLVAGVLAVLWVGGLLISLFTED